MLALLLLLLLHSTTKSSKSCELKRQSLTKKLSDICGRTKLQEDAVE
jgi:hypothetical protein